MTRRTLPYLASCVLWLGSGCTVDPGSETGDDDDAGLGDDDDDDDDDDDAGGGTIDDVIDDMEDGDGAIIEEGTGRIGAWYTYNDESEGGEQTPAMGSDFVMETLPEPRGESTQAAHTVGQGFDDWGAGVGFDLNGPDGADKGTYDASGYAALSFWAKRGEAGPSTVLVTLNDDQTSPEGGECDEAADECHDHFGAVVRLSDQWELHTVKFADLAQEGWGKAFDAAHVNALYAIQFQIASSETFDLWIDDIGFGK